MAGGAIHSDQVFNVPGNAAGSGVAGNRLGGQAAQPYAHKLTAEERAGAMPAAVRYQGHTVSVFADPVSYVAGHGLTLTDPAMAAYITPQQATELVAEMTQAMGRMQSSGSARLVSTTVHASSASRPDFSGTSAQRSASVHRRVSATFARA
ncbi:hypothetical protein [Paraburkholderia sp. DGU8]|uniref:hypothetical protein n=1 Tax=Paraburkholderia sp. DGU8 TaxID=3161997 RepID=UPI00346715FB